MFGFDYDHYPQRLQLLKKSFGDLLRQPFLQLQPASKDLGDPGKFRQPHDPPAFRDIGNVTFPYERSQMMFANGRDRYVFDQDHLVV
jgi:hypothetical protein